MMVTAVADLKRTQDDSRKPCVSAAAPEKRCLLVTGGSLAPEFASGAYKSLHWDLVIAADAGLWVCEAAGIFPDHIVGDFDSLHRSLSAAGADDILDRYALAGSRIHRFKPEKDDTDTQIGAKLALDLGCGKIRVLGGTGTRLDHILGSLQVMEYVLRRGGEMVMTDPHNRVMMHASSFTISRAAQWGRYVSLIPWGGTVEGLTLRGLKYPLEDASLSTAQSLGISNEVTGELAEVSFRKGILVAVESRD